MNILILRVSAIGDVIHTLPSIFLIKKVLPNTKISWVVQKKAAALLVNQPFLDNVYVLPDKFLSKNNLSKTWKIIKQIKREKSKGRSNSWDVIIDFQGILKTSILSFFIPGKKFGFDYKNARLGLTSLFTNKQITPSYTNIIQKNLALATGTLQEVLKLEKTLNVSEFKTCPTIDSIKNSFKLTIPKQDKEIVNIWLKQNKINKFIILSPNTTWPSKHWPEENWIKLIKIISKNNYSIILIGKDFGQQAKSISEETFNTNVFASPKWNLLQTSYLISKSNLLIAPDTGILHIADFLQKKSIGIFGPTLAKKHGPFLLKENIKNAIQIKCPNFYQKTHRKKTLLKHLIFWKSKTYNNIDNCMYKLSPEDLARKIYVISKKEKQ